MNPPSASTVGPSDYVVVARRYRPQSFDELIGQEHVAKALSGAIASDRVGHAYLFTGARGVGKTSAARILAKALNCVKGPAPASCNVCEICQSVAMGDDVDVLEIDGASNRGIDEIRQLRQNVAVRPSRSRFKIYIIDEVHMLTKEAFNALLKTLEEPPEHVKFIFATTEPNKIPITILSRCQRYDFAGIDATAIRTRLAQIAESEGVEVTPEALQIIAMRAAGSMRDSQSLLEQLLSTGAKTISADAVTDLLGLAPAARISQLVQPMINHDPAGALAALDAALADGAEVGQLIDQLLGYFRDAMTQTVGCDESQMLYALPGQRDEIRQAAQQFGVDALLAISQILDATAARLRVSTQGRTLAEMAVVRICRLENLDELSALLEHLKSGGRAPTTAAARTNNQPDARSQPSSAADAPETRAARTTNSADGQSPGRPPQLRSDAGEDADRSAGARPSSPPPQRMPKAAISAAQQTGDEASSGSTSHAETKLDASAAERLWRQALHELSGLVAENAAEANSVFVDAEGRIVASFPQSRAFCRDACQRPANLEKLEAAVAKAYGRPVRLAFQLHEDPACEPAQQQPAKTLRQQHAEASSQPLVQKAMQLFDGDPGSMRYVPPEQR